MLVIEQFQNPELTLKDDVYTCALADKIISESQETDEWYEYFDDFASLLNQQKTLRESTMIIEAVLLMVILQFVREFSERLLNPLFPGAVFAEQMITMMIMIVLSGTVVLYARIRKSALSVFPKHFGKTYIIASCVSAILLISTPSNFTGGCQAIFLLIYGSIVTPVFEELIFRGYIWNRFNAVLSKEIFVFIWSVILFTVWHIGYMIPQIVAGNINAVLNY